MRALLVILLSCLAAPAAAQDHWSDPHPGVRLLSRTTADPNRVFVAVVDLEHADLSVRATRSDDRGAVTSAFARAYGCAVAINGDFYGAGRQPIGLAVGDGEIWPGTRDGALEGFIAVGADNRAIISPPAETVDPPAEWMREVVSGRPMVVEDGRPVEPADCGPHFCERHPRTAVGLDAEGHTLYLMVVDGRSAGSRGMTTHEVGEVLAGLGAHVALNLDGGGSTALYVAGSGGVVNTPSDGAERSVANHLGVVIMPATGTLQGFVRADDVFDEAAGLADATVRLSSGEAQAADGRGFYRFDALPPGEVELEAQAPGFTAARRVVQIAAGEVTWGSIALSADAADAGPQPELDGGRSSDPDAGAPLTGDAGWPIEDDAEGFADRDVASADLIPDASRPVGPDDGIQPGGPTVDAAGADGSFAAADDPDHSGCAAAPGPSPIGPVVCMIVLLGVVALGRRCGLVPRAG